MAVLQRKEGHMADGEGDHHVDAMMEADTINPFLR